MLYTENDSTLFLPVLLSTCLVLYSLDLANLRNISLTAVGFALVVLSVTNAYDEFRNNSDTGLLYPALQVAVETIFLACWVCHKRIGHFDAFYT